MPSKDICGVRVKAFSRAPPGPTREPDQDFTSSVLGPTITLSITARGPFIEKEWRRTNFVTFLRLIFERVGTIDIAWEWLRDSYLCVGIQLKPFGHALAWNTFNANQSQFRFLRQGFDLDEQWFADDVGRTSKPRQGMPPQLEGSKRRHKHKAVQRIAGEHIRAAQPGCRAYVTQQRSGPSVRVGLNNRTSGQDVDAWGKGRRARVRMSMKPFEWVMARCGATRNKRSQQKGYAPVRENPAFSLTLPSDLSAPQHRSEENHGVGGDSWT
ncbi:hypothetical protein C8R43DRAFT_953922 [Mycena crocata]|nr:hypothetical protein C8R43DRAFT_953922 [Mycena crocata]